MNCREFKDYLYPFLDGELDNQASQVVKDHISTCPLCRLVLEQEKTVDSLIADGVPREKAPYGLKEEILRQIAGLKEKKIGWPISPVLKPAVIGATGVILTFVLLSFINRPFPVYSETVKEHIQFLQGNLPIDITSDKPEEVHRWFQTKLDFKFMVPELSSQGVDLLGARLCTFKDKKVAYIMYKRDGQKLSVFMFNAEGVKFPKAKRIAVNNKIFYLSKDKGYNSALWVDEGIACVFVSDLDEAELLYLASL